MLLMKKPNFSAEEVYDCCIRDISNPLLKNRLASVADEMIVHGAIYETRAKNNTLHEFTAHGRGEGSTLVLGDVTKDELVDLYETEMVGQKKAARYYYDKIMMLAPLNLCPLCRISHVSTLDHFLAKSQYPKFSVLPNNLIPTCKDCNPGKKSGNAKVNKSNQLLHPYFEARNIETDTWLFSQVLETVPAIVKFYVKKPSDWGADLYGRTVNHFIALDLGKRYAIQAAAELQSVSGRLKMQKSTAARKKHLLMCASAERQNPETRNSWKAALYEALSNSKWFFTVGYLTPR